MMEVRKGQSMKKFVLVGGIVAISVLGIALVDDPLNALVSFVIAGVIPGTNVMLGLWPTIGLGILLSWSLLGWLKHIRLQALEHTARQIRLEAKPHAAIETSESPFDRSKRSVVAAPVSNVVI